MGPFWVSPLKAFHHLLAEEELSAEARACTPLGRRLVRNAHRNLGHPSRYALIRLMKTAKVHPDLINYAREFKCPICERRRPPDRIPRVTLPYRPTRFNVVVGLDIKSVRDASGREWKLLNLLDLATTFNLVYVLKPDASSGDVAQVFKDGWIGWAGLPEKMVVDRGGEFQGQFGQGLPQPAR